MIYPGNEILSLPQDIQILALTEALKRLEKQAGEAAYDVIQS